MRPWRRSTSWMPAIQPAKSCRASKTAAFMSVTAGASAGPPAAPRRPARASPPAARLAREGRHEVDDDAVVVAGVEREVVAPGVGHGAHDVVRPIAAERGDLDRPHARQLGERPPERVVEDASADGGLEVEAE